mmetsp:Transcript_32308/g.54055  ORF Transcript_32308/g.54055 Transcript_32308/m.54055 type:complete len:601 (+) Transcript_32308:108-1910(+)
MSSCSQEDEIHGTFTRALLEEEEEVTTSSSSSSLVPGALLLDMQQELQSLPLPCKRAYERGLQLNSRYIHNAKFRLGFLRAELFDSHKAALRFSTWLELLLDYYGDMALTRKLTMTDLGKDELKLMKTGCMQLLSSRDRSGRRVAIFLEDAIAKKETFSIYSRIKLSIFIMSLIAEDAMTQRQGLVMITKPSTKVAPYSSSFFAAQSSKDEIDFARLLQAIPFRISGDHIWMAPSSSHSSLTNINYAVVRGLVPSRLGQAELKEQLQTNLRIHYGPSAQIEGILQDEFGIPARDIPLTSTGTLKTNNWNNFIKFHLAAEYHQKGLSPFKPGVECPDFQSIVFRKVGGPSSVSMDNHPPNKVFRSIIVSALFESCNGRKRSRDGVTTNVDVARIVYNVITEVKKMKWRFLTWDHRRGWYVDITNEAPSGGSGGNSILRALVTHAVKERIAKYPNITTTNVASSGSRSSRSRQSHSISSDSNSSSRDRGRKQLVEPVSSSNSVVSSLSPSSVADDQDEDDTVGVSLSDRKKQRTTNNGSDDDGAGNSRDGRRSSTDDNKSHNVSDNGSDCCLRDDVESVLMGVAALVALNTNHLPNRSLGSV